MAKLALLLLVALLPVSQVSSAGHLRTIISTTVDGDDDSGHIMLGGLYHPRHPTPEDERCLQELQRQQMLDHCKIYLLQSSRSYSADIMSTNENRSLRRCCEQVSNLDEKCRCDGIITVVMKQMANWTTKWWEAKRLAEDLLSGCNIGPVPCQM